MQVDGGEGRLAGELKAHHNHSCHPEEQDVVAGLHHLQEAPAQEELRSYP